MVNSECRIQNCKKKEKTMDIDLILKVAGEQIKTVDNCFYRSECAETRSNGSEACPHEQYDYVSRGEKQWT